MRMRFTRVALFAAAGLGVTAAAASATPASQPRWIELVLDASGSMTAMLPSGSVRIEAARGAVEKVVAGLPPGTRLAFRAYGHQSPREKHDCADTQLLVPFGDVAQVRAAVTAAVRTVQPRGYTPITRVIELAARDFPPVDAASERVLVLVSDGKETCESDPCAAARALAAVKAKLTIHTVGFGVDTGARFQLQCIASATGGTYFGADDAQGLATVLGQAVAAEAKAEPERAKGPGRLQVKPPDQWGHKVTEAATGAPAGEINPGRGTLELPAGLYNVTFGGATWKSVEVKARQTTVLEPGVLRITAPGALGSHEVRDTETGANYGELNAARDSLSLLPGIYDVTFGETVWPGVTVDAAAVTELKPGVVQVVPMDMWGHVIRAKDGRKVGEVNAGQALLALPPGEYTVEIGGQRRPFALREGEKLDIPGR